MVEYQTNVLEMKNISKSFPGVQALDEVTLNIKPGIVHALMGENGAGKSTLMKILIGIYTDYEGEIFYKGKKLSCENVKQILDNGISMIHQELNYIPHMNIAENIFLGKEPKNRFYKVKKAALHKKTKELLDKIGVGLDPQLLMKDLSVSEKQMVEIAKAISYDSSIIIMDEPTSAISDREVEKLFQIVKDLKNKGVSIIYISHKMDEIFRIADEVTVLRDGTYIGTYNINDIDTDRLVSLMVGRQLKDVFPKRYPKVGSVMLSVDKLSKKEDFTDISFKVHAGEILGVAGLMGSGRTEVMECIFGLETFDSGDIYIKEEKVEISSPSDAMELGIGLISEDRKTLGLILPLTVRENITISNLHLCSHGSFIIPKKENQLADQLIQDLSIKTPNRDQVVNNLSGGNQQKIVIGKTLLSQSDIIILDEPTRGIDVGAKSEIYKLITQLADEGKAIIVVSSELPEILGMSDRILVLHEGKVTGELTREEANQEKIMKLAVGN